MTDFEKRKVEVVCDKCGGKVPVTLKQIADQVTVSCRCGEQIQLKDAGHKAKEVINTFDDFHKKMKRFGK